MADDKKEILRKLEELLSMDNSDKEYLIDGLLKDREIKDKVSESLIKVVENMIKHEDSNNVIKNLIGKIVEKQLLRFTIKHLESTLEEVSKEYSDKRLDVSKDINNQAQTFSSKVENELRAVLATDVATALYEQLSSKSN